MVKRLLFITVCCSIGLRSVSAADAKSSCDGTGVRAFDPTDGKIVAENQSGQNSKEYVISLSAGGLEMPVSLTRFMANVSPPKGTVIYLCGGPSECTEHKPRSVPSDYDVITFDYIGLGKNGRSDRVLTPEMMSLESQAKVVKEIVRLLKLNDYVVYGQSFGTTVATVAAAQITSESERSKGLKQPQAVILDGTFGSRDHNDISGYSATAQRAWGMLSDNEKDKFRKAIESTRKDLSLKGLSVNKVDLFWTKKLWEGPKETVKTMRSWMGEGLNEVLRQVDHQKSGRARDNDAYGRVYDSASCQFMARQKAHDKGPEKFFDGLIVNAFSGDICTCRTVERDFKPRDHQICSPVLYINGEYDPATPFRGALDHFQSQTCTKSKLMIKVEDGGHFGSSRELLSCMELIYSRAFMGNLAELKSYQELAKRCSISSPDERPTKADR